MSSCQKIYKIYRWISFFILLERRCLTNKFRHILKFSNFIWWYSSKHDYNSEKCWHFPNTVINPFHSLISTIHIWNGVILSFWRFQTISSALRLSCSVELTPIRANPSLIFPSLGINFLKYSWVAKYFLSICLPHKNSLNAFAKQTQLFSSSL